MKNYGNIITITLGEIIYGGQTVQDTVLEGI